MKTKELRTLAAGNGFDVGADFARAAVDTPVQIARDEYAKPGHVIGYIAANPHASLGFLKYGGPDGVRIHCRESALIPLTPARKIALREEFSVSLPHADCKCFIDEKPVSRADFITARSSLDQIFADESHSAGGVTVRHILGQINAR